MSDPCEESTDKRFVRSAESLAFQQMWLRLPHKDLIADRETFEPRFAKDFLRHIVLAQAPSPADPTLRIRLVGDAVRRQVQGDIVGLNYLDFLEDESHKARVLQGARDLFERPCGYRWVAPVHYERDFSQYWEVTALPLAAGERSPAAVLTLVRPFDVLINSRRIGRKVVRIEPNVLIEAIEIHR